MNRNKIFTVALSALVVAAIMTSVAFQTANANLTQSDHSHATVNKNSEHRNSGGISNVDGSHNNFQCVRNTNNDKGIVCHDNQH